MYTLPCTFCSRRGIKVCPKTVRIVTDQGTDRAERAERENKNDPLGIDVVQNPSLEMGFINQAVSMEMDTRLQWQSDRYEKL